MSLSNLFRLSNFKYYTTWSTLLFYLVVFFYFFTNIVPTWLLFAVVVNIIAVGIVGNFLATWNFDNIMKEMNDNHPETDTLVIGKDLQLSNFLFHTLPFVLVIILLLIVRTGPFNMAYSMLFLIAFVLIWLLVPTGTGCQFSEKICEVYVDPPISFFLMLPFLWFFFLWVIQYSQVKCA